jgi:hypothetical protein
MGVQRIFQVAAVVANSHAYTAVASCCRKQAPDKNQAVTAAELISGLPVLLA